MFVLLIGAWFCAGVVVLVLAARGTLGFHDRFDVNGSYALQGHASGVSLTARPSFGAPGAIALQLAASPAATAPAEPVRTARSSAASATAANTHSRDALSGLRGPLQTVATLLRFVAGDGWDEARDEAVARLRGVGSRRDVAAALRAAERAAGATVDVTATIDRLATRLADRMDHAERACVADMVCAIAYCGSDSSARASRAAALLLKS